MSQRKMFIIQKVTTIKYYLKIEQKPLNLRKSFLTKFNLFLLELIQ